MYYNKQPCKFLLAILNSLKFRFQMISQIPASAFQIRPYKIRINLGGLGVPGWLSLKCLTLAQVMISLFVGSSPMSGSVLTAQSLEPASDSVSPSLSAPPPLSLSLSLSLSKISIKKIFKERNT